MHKCCEKTANNNSLEPDLSYANLYLHPTGNLQNHTQLSQSIYMSGGGGGVGASEKAVRNFSSNLQSTESIDTFIFRPNFLVVMFDHNELKRTVHNLDSVCSNLDMFCIELTISFMDSVSTTGK